MQNVLIVIAGGHYHHGVRTGTGALLTAEEDNLEAGEAAANREEFVLDVTDNNDDTIRAAIAAKAVELELDKAGIGPCRRCIGVLKIGEKGA